MAITAIACALRCGLRAAACDFGSFFQIAMHRAWQPNCQHDESEYGLGKLPHRGFIGQKGEKINKSVQTLRGRKALFRWGALNLTRNVRGSLFSLFPQKRARSVQRQGRGSGSTGREVFFVAVTRMASFSLIPTAPLDPLVS